jgi:non-ribosomal peptide synthetase component F
LRPLEGDDNVAMRGYDLYLRMQARGQEVVGGAFLYNRDLFEASTVARMADDLTALLGIVAAQPEVRLHEVAAMLAEQHRQQQVLQAQALEEASVQKLRTVRRKAVSA